MTTEQLKPTSRARGEAVGGSAGRVSTAALMASSMLGMSAASVGLSWAVGPLNLSTALLLLGLLLAVLQLPPRLFLSYRVTVFDLAALTYVATAVGVENLNAAQLEHDTSPGYAYGSLYHFAAYVAVRLIARDRISMKAALIGLSWPSVSVAALGILQLAGVGIASDFIVANTASSSLENRLELGASIRATSTIGHWTALGAYLCAIIAVACVLLVLERRISGTTSKYAIVVMMIGTAGAVATLTFASIFVAIALLLVAGRLAGVGKRLIATLGVVSLMAWGLFGSLITERIDKQSTATANIPEDLRWLPQTIGYRIVLWTEEGVPAWLARPWTGWGAGTWHDSDYWPFRPPTVAWPSPESEWIKALVSAGSLGLVALIFLLAAMHHVMMAAARESLGSAAIPALVLFWGFLLVCTIAPYFTNQGAPAVVWPLVAAFTWAATSRESPDVRSPSSSAVPRA